MGLAVGRNDKCYDVFVFPYIRESDGGDRNISIFRILGLFLNGWLSILPLIALQTWLAIQWKNFSLPIALNFAFIIPNIFVTGSKYGRYYPWSQPAYAMTPENQLGFTQTTQDLYLAVIGGFLLFSLAGVWNFMRTEMK